MTSAITSTTTIIPVTIPALKMSPITSQLVKVVHRKAIIASGKYLLIVINFVFLVSNKYL